MELNRRNFMKGAAVASAFLPRFNILHADDITIGPKDDTINVAMIGFGAEGKVLAASLVRIPGVRVRCVCDIWKFEQQRAKAFFKGYGHDVKTYEDYREMLEKEDKNFVAEHLFYLLVGRVGRHLALELLCSENLREVMSRSVLLVSVDEKSDEIALRHLVLGTCFLHRLGEGSVCLVVGEVLDYVRNAHFEDYIHTALEVKTKSDLCLEALLV